MAKAFFRHVNVLSRTSFAFGSGWPDRPDRPDTQQLQGQFLALGSLASCAVFCGHLAFKTGKVAEGFVLRRAMV